MNHYEIAMANKKPQKVLVTGGGGFLGGAIVKLLVQRGDHVRSLARSFYPELAALNVEQFQGDISDSLAVDQACEGVNLVFHVAAKAGVWGAYSEYHQTNFIGTKNVITACRRHSVPQLIYTSSPSIIFTGTDLKGVNESVPYPETFHTPYQKTKALAEQLVVAAGKELLTIILRPHLIWGPHDNHLLPRIINRANRLLIIGNGKNLVDTIYIDNAADAHILAADKLEKNNNLSGNIYFISQGQPVVLWDMINDILKAAGQEPVKRSIPHRTARLIGLVLELIYRSFRLKGEPPMTRFVADELATSHWFDISAAKKDLEYKPKVSTAEGLRYLEDWLAKNTLPGVGK